MYSLEKEKSFFYKGIKLLGAIDEAGRGPLAGPVVAACIIVNQDFRLSGKLRHIKDSKKLSEKKREELFDIIQAEFIEVGVGICDHKTIDRINILEASFLAMKKAIGALKSKPDTVILDGKFPIPNLSIPQKPIIRGDNQVFSIAAASIIAKVTRDRIMHKFHKRYPKYGFNKHKGYGTKMHMKSLEKHGPCPFHRQSFKPVKELLENSYACLGKEN